MSILDPLHDEITVTEGVIESAIALINGLVAKLDAALASDDINAEVASLSVELKAKREALAAAIAIDPEPVNLTEQDEFIVTAPLL